MKKILSMLILCAMLISLAACGGSGDTAKDTTSKNTTAADTGEVLAAGIERKNYDTDFTILYPDWGLYRNYYFVEENTGEAMDVALYNRELKVEEYLGLDVKFEMADNAGDNSIAAIYPSLQQMAMTGDNLYQIALTHCIKNTAVMITDGLLLDLNTVETIDFDNDWWNHTSNDNLEVYGHQFYAISDFIIPDPNAVLFNKGMIESLGLEDPYQLVRDSKWTVDKMMEMMSVATADDGNGEWNEYDTYGFATPDDWFLSALTYSMGEQIATKDEEGNLMFALDNPRAYTVFEKIEQLLLNPDTYIYGYHLIDVNGENPSEVVDISTNRCLFNLTSLNMLNTFRNTNVDFGILPYPKLDEAQEDYISIDWTGLMCAPLIAKDHNMIGEVMELFAYYSSEEVLPAYYDIVLGEKLSRDNESREMMDIIFDGVIFDAGMSYFALDGNMYTIWRTPTIIAQGKMAGYASHLGKYAGGASYQIEKFNAAVWNLE